MLQFNLDKAIKEIKKAKAKRILLQLPEGLKTRATELIEEIQSKTGTEVIALMDPCFGACDVPEEKASVLGADLIVHFGHEKFFKPKVKTIFVPLHYDIDAVKCAEKLDFLLKGKNLGKIGLCASIQFIPAMQEIRTELEKKGFIVFVGKGNEQIAADGQVLGCNHSCVKDIEEESDAIVFLGDGHFHALGTAFASQKKVFAFNPLNLDFMSLETEKEFWVRKRYAVIAKAIKAKSFGIIISTKKGQTNKKLAQEIKKKIEEKGFRAFLLALDLVRAEFLEGVQVDCFVNTACPRLAEDFQQYKKAFINASELNEVLK
ncbi:MAG: diphthamide biosynthesis enzyme Dph2 [Candidatus Diapherotrites archaeon]